MDFADIEYPNKELVTTLAFASSSFKKENIMTVMQPEYRLQTRNRMRTRLDISSSTMYCNFQNSVGFVSIMTAW